MVQGHALIETIMEHAAAQLGLDPLSLKMNNMLARGDQILPPPLFFGKISFNEIDFFMTFLDDENPLEMMIEQHIQRPLSWDLAQSSTPVHFHFLITIITRVKIPDM